MLSLIELAKKGKLEKTGAKPKLPIKVDGVSSEILDVYKIPLEYLYYNDKNGRIVDGNRRYTALRNIHQTTGRTVYLKLLSYPSHMTPPRSGLKLRNSNWPSRWGLRKGKIMTQLI